MERIGSLGARAVSTRKNILDEVKGGGAYHCVIETPKVDVLVEAGSGHASMSDEHDGTGRVEAVVPRCCQVGLPPIQHGTRYCAGGGEAADYRLDHQGDESVVGFHKQLPYADVDQSCVSEAAA